MPHPEVTPEGVHNVAGCAAPGPGLDQAHPGVNPRGAGQPATHPESRGGRSVPPAGTGATGGRATARHPPVPEMYMTMKTFLMSTTDMTMKTLSLPSSALLKPVNSTKR